MVRHVSGKFGPPWPDLVIAAGTPSEPVCARIRVESRSTRQVFLGRPWAKLNAYDLIVTTPQYRVPDAPNVMCIDLPLHRVTSAEIAREAALWSSRIADLPRPYAAVFLGGGISRYTLDSRAAKRLALAASGLVAPSGGSLLVCSSYRTPRRAMKVLRASLDLPCHVFDWHQRSKENPYLGFLGLADHLIVTGDSMTMLAEACATGKPVHIFDLGEGRYGMRQPPVPSPKRIVARPWLMSALRARAKNFKVMIINKVLPARFQRDTRTIHRKLVQSGMAVWLGDAFPAERLPDPQSTTRDLAAIISRIRSQLGRD
jgi:hypothetical protein